MSLEWIYRLAQGPRRLFERYLKTIPPFIWLVVKQILQESGRGQCPAFRF